MSSVFHYVQWGFREAASAVQSLKVYLLRRDAGDHDPTVFVQLREAIECMRLPTSWPPHRWYKRFGCLGDWELLCRELGCCAEDLRPSRKQGVAAGLSREALGQCRQETVCTTRLLLCHLVQWSELLRGDRRAQAKRLLGDILRKVLTNGSDELNVDLPAATTRDGHDCDQPVVSPEGSECSHVQALVASAPVRLGVESLRDLLCWSWAKRYVCPAMRRWHFDLILATSGALDSSLLRPACWRPTAEGVCVARGQRKRRRIDEDMLRGAALGMLTSKRFRPAAAARRAGNLDCHEKIAADHEGIVVRDYISARQSAMRKSSQITVAFDETTVSAESTMGGCLYDHVSRKAAVLVPQACRL